jgi:hypothetical protein
MRLLAPLCLALLAPLVLAAKPPTSIHDFSLARIDGAEQPLGGPVEWNFQKYLVARDGEVVARFTPRTVPDDPALVARLEELLDAAKPRP